MKTRSTPVLIVCGILALLSLVCYYLLFTFVDGLGAKTQKASNDAAYAETKYDVALSHKAVANTGESAGAKLDAFILPDGGEIGVVRQLEQIASGLSLTLNTDTLEIQPSPTLDSDGKEFLHIIVYTTGSFTSTQRFLSILETLPYNVKFNQVGITQKNSGTASSTGVWQGQFDFSIVKQKPPQQ